MEDNAGFDLLEESADIIERTNVSSIVGGSWISTFPRVLTEDRDFFGGRIIKKSLREMMSHKATPSNY